MTTRLSHATAGGLILLAILGWIVAGCVPAAPTPRADLGQRAYSASVRLASPGQAAQTLQVNYLLYLPDTYGQDPHQRWPLILYLHGRGERGQDLDLLKSHPLPETLEQKPDFPFIVVSPQLSLETVTWSGRIEALNALLDQLQATYAVDARRIYLTGLSMGGFGTWEFALRHPGRFAAIVPIAGGYDDYGSVPANICDLKDLPVWAFHGGADTIVPVRLDQVLVDALRACGGDVRFTLYPEADHEATWRRAYADPQLYEWLLSHSLK